MPNIGDIINGSEIGRRKEKTHDHKYVWAACQYCGKERWVVRFKGEPRSKSCRNCELTHRRGTNNANWTGGRNKIEGYIYLKLLPDDFFYTMTNNNGYVFEHRLVMAKHLGRNLHPWEVVHHKNSIRDDNRLENLEIHSDMGHKGRHIVEEKIKFLEKRIKALEVENERLCLIIRDRKIVELRPIYLDV